MMQFIANWVLAIFTIVLAAATIALAVYTKTLTLLTGQMVDFQKREKRRADLKKGLDLIESIHKLVPEDFVAQLSTPGTIPEPGSTYVRELALLTKYIVDSGAAQCLKELRQCIDSVQQGISIGGNGPAIVRLVIDLKQKLGWSVTKWRDELEA